MSKIDGSVYIAGMLCLVIIVIASMYYSYATNQVKAHVEVDCGVGANSGDLDLNFNSRYPTELVLYGIDGLKYDAKCKIDIYVEGNSNNEIIRKYLKNADR